MKRWSLRVKFGAYAALLTMIALAITAAVVLPALHYHQLHLLDAKLADSASELVRDLRNFRGAPVDPRRPLRAQLIPPALRDSYLVVRGPEGQILYRSPKMQEEELVPHVEGVTTGELFGRPTRVGTFQHGPYLVQVGTDMESIQQFDRTLRLGFLLAVPIAGLVVFAGGLVFGRAAIKPVSNLTTAAERISTSNPDERLPMPTAQDEIARLTTVLNDSFDRLQKSYQAAQRFSADASHQLKTPVAVLQTGLESLRDCDYFQPDERDEVHALLQQTQRLASVIEDLLLLARAEAGLLDLERSALDLALLVEAALDDLSALVGDRAVTLEHELAETLPAYGDARRVAIILQNLVENAAKYTPGGGTIRITADSNGEYTFVRIANTGPTIPPAEFNTIFERFHRADTESRAVAGYGLGLNIARALARANSGDLVLLRSDHGWTEFELRLPSEGPSSSRRLSEPPAAPPGHRET